MHYLNFPVKRLTIMSNDFFNHYTYENAPFNRKMDRLRCEEICKTVRTQQDYIDGIIHIYFTDKYYCYDGIHRLEASKHLYDEGIYKLLTIDIIECPEPIALNHFRQINNRVEVPDVIITAQNNDIYDIVDEFFTGGYASHLSPSPRCKKPNICRDVFVQKIKLLEGDILNELQMRNSKCAEYVKHKKLKCTEKQLQKCHSTGLYLFLFDDWINPPFLV